APGRVAIPTPTKDDPNEAVFRDAARRLRSTKLDVVTLPSPGRILGEDGDIIPASYMNFYIGNAVVVVPQYGAPMDRAAVDVVQALFPDRVAIGLRAESDLVREAAGKGAEVVLPPELFEGPYFCRVEDESLFANARPANEHPSVLAMQELAAELKIWIPTSFFEADGPHFYNSLAM